MFKKSASNPEGLISKRENHFLALLSPMALSSYKAQMLLAASAAFAPQREEYVENVPISPLGTTFYSVHGFSHYLQITKLEYVNSIITIYMEISKFSTLCPSVP